MSLMVDCYEPTSLRCVVIAVITWWVRVYVRGTKLLY